MLLDKIFPEIREHPLLQPNILLVIISIASLAVRALSYLKSRDRLNTRFDKISEELDKMRNNPQPGYYVRKPYFPPLSVCRDYLWWTSWNVQKASTIITNYYNVPPMQIITDQKQVKANRCEKAKKEGWIAWYVRGANKAYLTTAGINPTVLLHEIVHHIVYWGKAPIPKDKEEKAADAFAREILKRAGQTPLGFPEGKLRTYIGQSIIGLGFEAHIGCAKKAKTSRGASKGRKSFYKRREARRKRRRISSQRSKHIFYDTGRQAFYMASPDKIAIKEAFVWRDPRSKKSRIIIAGNHIHAKGKNLVLSLPFAPEGLREKYGKLLIRGRTWKVHLKLVVEKPTLMAAEHRLEHQPDPGTSEEGLEETDQEERRFEK